MGFNSQGMTEEVICQRSMETSFKLKEIIYIPEDISTGSTIICNMIRLELGWTYG